MSRQDANAAFALTSFLYGSNAAYIEDLYARYEADPNSVDAQWQSFFQSLKDDPTSVTKSAKGASWKKPGWPQLSNGELVAALDGSNVRGYAAIVRQDAAHLGLRRARLADLVVADGDEAITRVLLAAACDAARADGAAMLEAVGFEAATRRVFAEAKPREIVDQAWPFLYRAVDPALDAVLARESAWRACLYDGDGSL